MKRYNKNVSLQLKKVINLKNLQLRIVIAASQMPHPAFALAQKPYLTLRSPYSSALVDADMN